MYTSSAVSSHFLIGKDGSITQFFDNVAGYTAWHVGKTLQTVYSNSNSIGIECHYTPGEDKHVPKMIKSLTDLTRYMMELYKISNIAMHRTVAYPKGRKVDPSFFTDSEFNAWVLRCRT